MTLNNPSEECLAITLKEYGSTMTRVREDVLLLKDWILTQPHLPRTLDDRSLLHMLVRCKSSVERTKQAIDMHFTLKAALPEYFADRDPQGSDLNYIMKNTIIAPLPVTTTDGYRVMILKTLEKDTNNFNPDQFFKLALMIADLRMPEDDSVGDVYIYDCEIFGIGHISKITLPLLKKMEICSTKGYRARIKGVHFINAPPVIDVLLTMVKKVLKSKLMSRHHVHANLMSLYQHVEKDILPIEYGGKERSILQLHDDWQKKLMNKREWFLDQEQVGKANESKRPGKSFNTSDLFGFEGTFKQLTVD